MTAPSLDRILTCYRIGDPNGAYPIFDATGSQHNPGRWNTPASPMIYASEHYSTAMLEKLVHGSGDLPPNQHFIAITIPSGVSYEVVTQAALQGWDDDDQVIAKQFGETWQQAKRSLLLIVPSFVARIENNFLINPDHPEVRKVTHSFHHPVWWDSRLY